MVKNPHANAGDAIDMDLIPGFGRSLEKEMATHFNIPVRKIPWTKERGGLFAVHGVAKSQT